MYNIKKNNFYENEKKSTIYTPKGVSNFLFEILKNEFDTKSKSLDQFIIFDPCVGAGSLLEPWADNYFNVLGFDIVDQGFANTKIVDYLSLKKEDIKFKPDLVVINPPFNFEEFMRSSLKGLGFSSRPLLPELFLAKTIELFGIEQKFILFTPYGLRLNIETNSKRLRKFLNGNYPEITGIVSLPKNIYNEVKFHSEILFFNTTNNKPHYFYQEDLNFKGEENGTHKKY